MWENTFFLFIPFGFDFRTVWRILARPRMNAPMWVWVGGGGRGLAMTSRMLLKSFYSVYGVAVRKRRISPAADGDGRKSAWSERDKAGNSVRRAAHSFQYRARNSCRPYTSRSVSLRSPSCSCCVRTSQSTTQYNIVVLVVVCVAGSNVRCPAVPAADRKPRRYRWGATRLANNVMFQCIVQPKNTWSRSSPELRELRVVYPGDTLIVISIIWLSDCLPIDYNMIVYPVDRRYCCSRTSVGLPRVSGYSLSLVLPSRSSSTNGYRNIVVVVAPVH